MCRYRCYSRWLCNKSLSLLIVARGHLLAWASASCLCLRASASSLCLISGGWSCHGENWPGGVLSETIKCGLRLNGNSSSTTFTAYWTSIELWKGGSASCGALQLVRPFIDQIRRIPMYCLVNFSTGECFFVTPGPLLQVFYHVGNLSVSLQVPVWTHEPNAVRWYYTRTRRSSYLSHSSLLER